MKKSILIIVSIWTFLFINAQNPVKKFVESDLLKNANVSLMVKDLAKDSVLYEFRSNFPTIPASTMKTVTTSTALELLGGDYKFKTTLEYDGELTENGVLYGNLYICGNGDPTLGSSKLGDELFLHKWIEEIKLAGIKKIHGNIIADNSRYDDKGINQHWQWEDLGNYYGAGAYGISYKDNTYTIQINTKEKGTEAEIVKISPDISDINFVNELKITNIKSDSVYIFGAPRSNERLLCGELPANKSNILVEGDIPQPGKLLANDLKKELINNKIRVRGDVYEIFEKTCTPRNVIYTHFSPELREIVKAINVPSNNHYAEHLFRHLSLKNDSVASTDGAINVIKNYWKQKSLPIDQLFMMDGSGLSPVNAVSAKFLVELLTYMNKSKNNTDFRNSLPIAGLTGTAKILLDKTRLEGKVRAKSGTISRVRCYTGYLDDGNKKWAFAILVNNPNGKAKDVTDKIEEFLLEITQ